VNNGKVELCRVIIRTWRIATNSWICIQVTTQFLLSFFCFKVHQSKNLTKIILHSFSTRAHRQTDTYKTRQICYINNDENIGLHKDLTNTECCSARNVPCTTICRRCCCLDYTAMTTTTQSNGSSTSACVLQPDTDDDFRLCFLCYKYLTCIKVDGL